MRKSFFGITFLLLQSCTKEESTAYYAYLENKTTHKIEVKPFIGGVVNTSKVITLLANDKLQIANGIEPGISNGGFQSSYFGGADSLLVVYDNVYAMVHYGAAPPSLNPKHRLFTNARNVGNWRNYQLTQNNVSKFKRENTFLFQFVEQDYLDAK